MQIEEHDRKAANEVSYVVTASRNELAAYGYRIIERVQQQVAERIADQIVREFSTEILSKIDTQAIATLAIAQSAAEIAKVLRGGR